MMTIEALLAVHRAAFAAKDGSLAWATTLELYSRLPGGSDLRLVLRSTAAADSRPWTDRPRDRDRAVRDLLAIGH